MADELNEFFVEYARAFSEYDAKSLVSMFAVPCIMVNDDFSATLATDDALASNMRGLFEHHRAQGVERASFSDLRIRELGPNLALVTVRWCVQRSGQPDQDFENTYNMVAHGGAWKILVSTTHAAQ